MAIFDDDDYYRYGDENRPDREENIYIPPPPIEEEGTYSTNPPDDFGGQEPYDFGTFELPSFSGAAMPSMQFIPPPQFHAPQFQAPSFEDAQNEPGYQFRLNSGTEALNRSAAARGVLRSGNTLADIMEYGQNFGAQEYNNVFQRALGAYDRNYRSAWDAFQPQIAGWQFQQGANRDFALAGYDRQWQAHALAVQAALERERMLMQSSMMQPPPPPVLG